MARLGPCFAPPEVYVWVHVGNLSQDNQRKTKGQQLKGKIVSEFFTLFIHFLNFSPRTFPFETEGFSSMRTKRRKYNKITGQIDVAR